MKNMSLIEIMNTYLSLFPYENARLERLEKSLSVPECDLFSRKTVPGHITASGIVIQENSILMIFHTHLKRWLQPGGHIEKGETPLEAAQREVTEETGIRTRPHIWQKIHPMPFDIDIHTIPANPKKNEAEHLHYDFRYLLSPIPQETEKCEELKKAWVKFSDIKEANLKQLIEKFASLSAA